MSYNYLPLDHKPLRFHQLKNLLAYDQLVSITFTSHEHITENINQIKDIDFKSFLPQITQPLNSNASSEVPLPVVKLLLLLKIKSLSYGNGCVQIETVKTMMEMYNNGKFPVIYFNGDALYTLYESIQSNSKTELRPEEKFTLSNGSQFITACGLYTLIKAEVLLKKFGEVDKDELSEEAKNIVFFTKQYFNSCVEAYLKRINMTDNGLLFSIEQNTAIVNKSGKTCALEIQTDIFLIALTRLQQLFQSQENQKISKAKEWINFIEQIKL